MDLRSPLGTVEAQAASAYLYIPVQADRWEEQALHILKRYGALLFIVDEKGQGFPI